MANAFYVCLENPVENLYAIKESWEEDKENIQNVVRNDFEIFCYEAFINLVTVFCRLDQVKAPRNINKVEHMK